MKKEKILRLMIISISVVLTMSILSVRADSTALHISSTALESAKIDTSDANLKNDKDSYDPMEFLLGFSDKSKQDKVIKWLTNSLKAEIVAISNYTSLIHFKTHKTKGSILQSLVNTKKDFQIRYIQDHPEVELYDTWIPNDPYLGNQWYIDKIKAKEAWFYETGSITIKAAVIDVGCDMDHPDLAANLETWSDWDYVGNDGNPDALQSGWFLHSGNGHGTSCAGLIAAVQNNNKGVAGLADIELVNFRVGWINWFGGFETSLTYWIDAIYRAVDVSHADIISMSLSTSSNNQDLHSACDYAQQEGVLVVASAGNDGSDLDSSSYNRYPAEWDSVMCVAATTENDVRASFSNYGDQTVDISAPGTNIYTTHFKGGYRSDFGGTSASAPIVAGVAALIWSYNPSYSLTTLWNTLVDEADDIGNPQIRGRVNAYYSVINYWNPSSYTITPGALITGSYHSGSLSNLKKVDSLYFTWRTSYLYLPPYWLYGFSVDFYFPDHYISRLKVDLSFAGLTCRAIIHWFGGGSNSQYFSESLNYDCENRRIDHITIEYGVSPCPAYVYFDRVILVGALV